MRVVYDGADDIRALAPDLTDAEMSVSDFGSYTESDFFDDMARITQYRTDPDLCEILVRRSKETLLWMRDQGVRFMPNFGRQAYLDRWPLQILGRRNHCGRVRQARVWSIRCISAPRKTASRSSTKPGSRDLVHDSSGVNGVVVRLEGKEIEHQGRLGRARLRRF